MDSGDWIIIRIESLDSTGLARIFFHTIVLEKRNQDGLTFNVSVRFADLNNRPVARYGKEIKSEMFNSIEWISPVLKDLAGADISEPEGKATTETIRVNAGEFTCRIYSCSLAGYPDIKLWISDDTLFGGILKILYTDEDGDEIEIFKVIHMGKSGEKIPGGDDKLEALDYCPHADMQLMNEEQFENYINTAMTLDDSVSMDDLILNTSLKTSVNFDSLLTDLESVNAVFAGEEHGSKKCHAMQLNIIKGLNNGKKSLVIGFEMFNRTEEIQNGLDSFVNGTIDENTFRKDIYNSCWTEDWYDLYRGIFLYARDNGIRMVGLNSPEHLTEKFKNNPEDLTVKERSYFAGEIDYTDKKHREITLWNFSGMADAGMKTDFLYPGQCIWEDTMSESIITYLQENPDSRMVVCVGALHASYRVTIPGRSKKRADSAGMEFSYRVLFPDLADDFTDSSYDDFMLMDISDYVYFIPESEDELSWMEGYNLFNEGRIEEAEKSLENDVSYEARQIRKRINKCKKAKEYSIKGKYKKARKVLSKIPDAYEEAVEILMKKIDKAEKTGLWPE